jgi:hypothetical protein
MKPHPLLTWQFNVPTFTPSAWAGAPNAAAARIVAATLIEKRDILVIVEIPRSFTGQTFPAKVA